MRIIVLNDHGSITGGAAQVAIASLNGLAAAGIEVVFVSAVGPVNMEIDQEQVRVVNFGQFELLSDPSRLNAAIQGIWNSRAAEKLGLILDQYDPRDTLVHLHTWSKSLSPSIFREISVRGYKLVCTLHDYFLACPNGGLYDYPRQQHCMVVPMSLACLAKNCDSRSYPQKLWRYARQLVQQKAGGFPAHMKYFISVSDYSEELLFPYLPSSAKVFKVRNPINVERQAPASLGANKEFCFVGRLSPEKGGSLLAEAALGAGVGVSYVGNGEEAVKISKINPSARLLGWQGREDVIRAICASRALVFPSLWHETQGLVILEAAALGVPAIVSDDCAGKELVIDGETGMLFRSGDAGDLARCLRYFTENPELASQMGLNAYQRYWGRPCDLDAHVEDLLVCYKTILAE